jgi:hypothetical protein
VRYRTDRMERCSYVYSVLDAYPRSRGRGIPSEQLTPYAPSSEFVAALTRRPLFIRRGLLTAGGCKFPRPLKNLPGDFILEKRSCKETVPRQEAQQYD